MEGDRDTNLMFKSLVGRAHLHFTQLCIWWGDGRFVISVNLVQGCWSALILVRSVVLE